MSDYTPHVRTLAQRLRQLADELESADRYGVPVPVVWSINGYDNLAGVTFSADRVQFDAWADYTDGDLLVVEYDHDGEHWQRARADVNGLAVEFATSDPILEAVS